jgi:hypothetical protein
VPYLTDCRFRTRTSTKPKTFFSQRLNQTSTNARGDVLLPNVNHKWPFRFFLNDSLPPSYKHKKNSDYIYYFLRIVLVRPEWYKRNIKKIIPIVVKHASLPVDATREEAHEKNRKDVHLYVVLEKSVVATGKNVSFNLKIQNPNEVLIHRISVTLVQRIKLRLEQDKRINILNETLKTINQFKDSNLHENFQFHVPLSTPPTFQFVTSWTHKRPIGITYELHFEAHLSGISTNIRLQLPLIITDHPKNN